MSITGTLIIQMIVFLILVGFTMKYVWPPIAAALDERAKKIAEGLAAADKAKADLAAADARVEQEHLGLQLAHEFRLAGSRFEVLAAHDADADTGADSAETDDQAGGQGDKADNFHDDS